MDANVGTGLFGDSAALMLSVLIFLAVGTLAFAVMLGARARSAVRRRAQRVNLDEGAAAGGRSLRNSGVKAAQQLIDYATKHYSTTDSKDVKLLRRRLTQAGIYDPRAPQYFFFVRLVLAVGGAVVSFFVLPMLAMQGKSSFWLFVMVAGLLGYLTPSLWLDKRVKAKKAEHQAGFPDLMDLLVVCADAGLAMEASLDRVGRELGEAYPSLAANIHMATLEIRAGRTPQRGARSPRRPARPRRGALVRHLDPAIRRARLVHQRRAARLQRRHAPQAHVARRGESLLLAGQALGADDGVYFPDAVRGDPAAGHRAHVHGQLAVMTGEFPLERTRLSD